MKQVRSWMIFVIGLVAGFALGYFDKQLLTLTWKGEIGIGDLFNFVNTIIFAFLLQQYVTKRLGDKRVEKDHVITLVKESLKWLENVRNKFLNCYDKNKIEKTDEQEIKAQLKNFANSLSHIKLGLEQCKYDDDAKTFNEIDDLYYKYKAEITGGDFPSKPYNSRVYNLEETTYQSVHNKLLTLIFTINTR
jgi:hypothetical protein